MGEESRALRRWSWSAMTLGLGSSRAVEWAGSIDSGSNDSKPERSQP
jgi:hypothetical protein